MAGKHGGRRDGAGRPKGAINPLGLGEVAALRSMKHRIPEGMDAKLADAAGAALETMVGVMLGKVRDSGQARVMLAAATAVREDVCGRQVQPFSFDGLTDEQLQARYKELTEAAAAKAAEPGE